MDTIYLTKSQVRKMPILGRGSFGIVRKLDEQTAIKIFSTEISDKNKMYGPTPSQIERIQGIRTKHGVIIGSEKMAVIDDKLLAYTERLSNGVRFNSSNLDVSLQDVILNLQKMYEDIEEFTLAYNMLLSDLSVRNVLFDQIFKISIVDLDFSKVGSLDINANVNTNILFADVCLSRCLVGMVLRYFNLLTPTLPFSMKQYIWKIKLNIYGFGTDGYNMGKTLPNLSNELIDKLLPLFSLFNLAILGNIKPIEFINQLKNLIQNAINIEIQTLQDLNKGIRKLVLS